MPDFTLDTYRLLLETLLSKDYSFVPFVEYLKAPASRFVILRHDVDDRKLNSLLTARLENELGIRGTYYFRMVPESFDEEVIRQISELGHEVGYHYEDLSMMAVRGARYAVRGKEMQDQLVTDAIKSFERNLEILRRIVPIETICMHGSPLSRWDNRLLWQYYDYHDFGISGEPYFDLDFNEVLYLTDTGRRWDGDAVSVRDKAQGAGHRAQGQERLSDGVTKGRSDKKHLTPHTSRLTPFSRFHSTFDIIRAAQANVLPDRIMLTVHPQRWTNRPLPWLKELVWQNVKNGGKRVVVKSMRKSDL
jgi:hypothetical protein